VTVCLIEQLIHISRVCYYYYYYIYVCFKKHGIVILSTIAYIHLFIENNASLSPKVDYAETSFTVRLGNICT